MANVLVIDDEDLVRMTVEQILKRDGHTVYSASDGHEGLKTFRKVAVDVVVTDIIMPNKEGIETIMELRRIRPDVKIIAMSGGGRKGIESFLDLAEKLGANSVLKKPFGAQDISNAIKSCLEA
jgi:CheY-like chemotaxis protein